MAITNPTKYVTTRRLGRFKEKLAAIFADKDSDAVAGNIAKFDSSGNPIDSGKSIDNVKTWASVQTCEDIIDELT